MRKRTRARELALKLLYQADITKEDVDKILEDFWQYKQADPEVLDDHIRDFATTLVKGVSENLEKIDSIISAYAENWQLKRMAVIDRNIMRMSTFELLWLIDIPPKGKSKTWPQKTSTKTIAHHRT